MSDEMDPNDLDPKKVVPMFSDHEVLRAAKAEAERENRHQREERRKLESTIPESAMPCPRLELRWRKTDYECACDYNIVIPVFSADIRVGSPAQYGPELRFCTGWTTTSGGRGDYPRYPNGVIDVPFRDGMHAAWDSHTTGFPAFVVWQGQAQSIMPIDPKSEPVKEYKDEPDEEDKKWAPRTSYHVIQEARNVIKRHAFKVRDLRDKHRERSWAWLYFNKMFDDLMEQAGAIEDPGFTDFGDWVRFRADGIKIELEKRVCSECGADIPDDLTEACEHIFGEDARAFLGKKE